MTGGNVTAAKPGRIPCSVPFCRRTAPASKYDEPGTMIICGKHWRLGDHKLRLLWSRARKKDRATLCNRIFERVLRQAIERSAGVTS